jgi:acetolactate synthase-1/2/3 large subunit
MTVRTGARALVDCLLAQGVTTAFGVPGESYLAVLDALHDVSDRIRLIPNRHEGGAAFMAEAWAKLTGRPGVVFVTRGPGAANAAIGVHTAMQDGTPMVVFVGQVGTDMRGRGAFQEIDYRAVFGGLAKWAVEIDAANRVPELVGRAFATAQSGRPGPVVVALPEDMLTTPTEAAAGPALRLPRPEAGAGALTEIRERLAAAAAPLILVGGGGWSDAGRRALRTFAEANALPVLADFRRQDLFDNDSAAYVGDAGLGKPPAVRDAILGADVILALGSEFAEITTDGYTLLASPAPRQALVHVHPDAAELNKVYAAVLPIVAEPDAVARALAEVAVPGAAGREARLARLRAAHLGFVETPPQPGDLDMGAVMAHLQAVLPDDAILTNGAGNFAIWLNKHFRFHGGQRLLAPQSGAMGYGVPAAIAAKVAAPERCVVAFAGDGDFQMTAPELGTAMQAGACPIVLVINNGSYGTIRMHQEKTYPGRVSFTDLESPDFPTLARAYRFHGETVARTADFAPALARARAAPGGAVLELVVPAEAITPRQTLTALRDAALRG